DNRAPEFGVVVRLEGDRAIVSITGDVDLLTAPTLHTTITTLIEEGHLDIVLDLAGITFMDASGLGVIAAVSLRLAQSHHILTIQSAPTITRRILHITRLSELTNIDDATSEPDAGAGASDAWRVGFRPSNDTIDNALRRVTHLVGATLGGADGVSITLTRDGHPMTVAASNSTVMKMDEHQYATGEGPCLSAAADGREFHIASLAAETRWPDFVPLAIEQGIASILSTPLTTAGRRLGALNIYSNTEGAFGPVQEELASLFASQASGILADSGVDDADMDRQFADALLARQTIARAQGVLMERQSLTSDKAAAAIHHSARIANASVAAFAASIVASTRPDESGVRTSGG
ncbi:MAG: anti-sigma factor antagonist, partial [Ilumatobacteraceae bacterium]